MIDLDITDGEALPSEQVEERAAELARRVSQ
jgi:hypothetical protein